MRTMGSLAMVVGGLTLAGMLSGCSSFVTREEITEINKNMQQQQQSIDNLREMVKADHVLLKKLSDANPAATGQDVRAQMVAAAILLAENGSENVSLQGITTLGYLGGDKAEEALLRMIETKQGQAHVMVSALTNMRSKKLHDLVIKMLQENNPGCLSNIGNLLNNSQFSLFTTADVPVLEKALASIPDNDYNNNRYIRNNFIMGMLRIAPDKAVKYVCRSLITTSDIYRKREIIQQLQNHNISLGVDEWAKIIECLGPVSTANVELYSTVLNILQRFGDWRYTELVLPWADAAKINRNLGGQYLNFLLQVRDPKAAATLVALAKNKELIRSTGRSLADFPGIKLENGEYVLVSDAEMEKILANRAKVIEKLNELDKKVEDKK